MKCEVLAPAISALLVKVLCHKDSRRYLVLDALHFEVDAVAKVAPVTGARPKKLPSLFGCLGLNAPLFGTRNKHGCVEHPQVGFLF